MAVELNFEQMRADWATKFMPTKDHVDLHRRLDQSRNPHNEPYHNKVPRRDDAQIISDLCFAFADEALKQQYGRIYTEWLEQDHHEDPHTKVWKRKPRY